MADKSQPTPDARILRISARPEQGFRRCGVLHPAEAVDHPISRFSKEEIARLKNEPKLVVVEMDAPPASVEPTKE